MILAKEEEEEEVADDLILLMSVLMATVVELEGMELCMINEDADDDDV